MRSFAVLAPLLVASAAGAVNRHGYMPIQVPPALVAFETATRSRVATVDLSAFGRGTPTDVAASPIGQTVYVATNCQIVAIDTTTLRVSAAIPPPNEWCCARRVAINAVGSVVVATDDYAEGCGVVWTIDPQQTHITAQSEKIAALTVSGLAVSPDGTQVFVVIGGEDVDENDYRQVVVLDTATGAVLRWRQLDGGYDGDLAVSPNGNSLYVGDWSGSLTVLDAHTLDTITEVFNDPVVSPSAVFGVGGFAFAPDDRFAVVVLSKRFGDQSVPATVVQIRETARHTVIGRVYLDAPAGRPAIDPDTGFVYVPQQDALGRVAVVDPKRAEVVEQVALGEGPVAIAFGAGSQPLATPTPTPRPTPRHLPQTAELCAYLAHSSTADSGGGITTLNAETNVISRWLPIGQPPTDEWSNDGMGVYGVAVSPDGNTVYATTTGAVLVLDALSGTVRNRIEVGSGAGAIAVRPDGLIAYVGKPNAIGVIDLRTEALLDAFFVYGTPSDIAFTPDGAIAYITRVRDSDSVLAVDAQRHALLQTITVWHGDPWNGYYTDLGNRLAVGPDGESAYVAVDHTESATNTPNNRVAVVDRETQTVRAQWRLPIEGPPVGIAVNPDGSRLYVAMSPRFACRDDPNTGQCVPRSNAVIVLDTVSGNTVATLAIEGWLNDLAISPDGSVLYAANALGKVTAIDPKTFAILKTITVADSPGRLTLGFVRDGCPLRGAISPLPTRTPTPTWPPQYTATPAPPSPSPTPTSTTCAGACVAVELGVVRGGPGERVTIEARLRTGGWAVAGVSNQIEWSPSVPIPQRLQDQPDCRAGSDFPSDITAFSFGPSYYVEPWGPFHCWTGFDCTFVRAIVLAISDGPIPDGAVLYRCQVAIAPDAAPGRYPLRVQAAEASDPAGNRLPVLGVDGAIDVSAVDDHSDARLDETPSGGCQIGVRGCGTPVPMFSVAFVLSIARRARRRDRRGINR
ncbi:MAG TPA: YncE family protein [Candidatus Binatia bacterium]|nr:YncE family protein [Candidatus Binatia bacterium]